MSHWWPWASTHAFIPRILRGAYSIHLCLQSSYLAQCQAQSWNCPGELGIQLCPQRAVWLYRTHQTSLPSPPFVSPLSKPGGLKIMEASGFSTLFLKDRGLRCWRGSLTGERRLRAGCQSCPNNWSILLVSVLEIISFEERDLILRKKSLKSVKNGVGVVKKCRFAWVQILILPRPCDWSWTSELTSPSLSFLI